MSTTKDIFADIAGNNTGGRKEELSEVQPKKKPGRFFEKTDTGFDRLQKPDYEGKKEEFQKGLLELRGKYEKFTDIKYKHSKSGRKRTYVDEFDFRFEKDSKTRKVKIPHYTGPVGRWTAFYNAKVKLNKPRRGERIFLIFKGVDYHADVYVNKNHAGSHEGFFSPFEFDVTDLLGGDNELVVKVKNDIPTIGNGDMQVNGDKLYAATGIGWDGPQDGWHHCPAGGGIFDKVYFETRPEIFVNDIFAMPDIDENSAHITAEVFCHGEENREIEITTAIHPYNFDGEVVTEIKKKVSAGHGMNYYHFHMDMGDFKLWEPESPHMYICAVKICEDCLEKAFGMRKFHMDEDSHPKGSLYLNNKPVLLRGANEMGHLQLCVMREDYRQLMDDILIAKYCNMNFYRLTQRPVQEEIYHYCDMLGMMNQTDLPLFGYMRKNKFYEGVKQAGEMERHVRNHPSSIMVTYINEPFAPDKYELNHRHLSRRELELFFDACDASVLLENPSRVIKRVEGDYDPPTNKGLSDFHCYNMWYTNHAIPLGKLYAGYLPAIKKGWKTGCGEYGTEGLDNYEVMRKYYPKDWLPDDDDDYWIPDKIVKSQTNTMHGDWYGEQDNINDWIIMSQKHQEFATSLMTLALRRRCDMVVSTAIHLLIDAWPSGWMKTLLDVDRVPKRAYFSFKESLEPLKGNIRCDRQSAYSGEDIGFEAWILNDTPEDVSGIKAVVAVRGQAKDHGYYALEEIDCEACFSRIAGIVGIRVPEVSKKTMLTIDMLIEKEGKVISTDSFHFAAYPRPDVSVPVFCIGEKALRTAADTQGVTAVEYSKAKAVLVSSVSGYEKIKAELPVGMNIVFMIPEDGRAYEVDGKEYYFDYIFDPEEEGENCEIKGLSFVAVSDYFAKKFGKDAMSYWYNAEEGYMDHVAKFWVDGIEPLAFGYEKPPFGKTTKGEKKKMPVSGHVGSKRFLAVETDGRAGFNPALDNMLTALLTEENFSNRM